VITVNVNAGLGIPLQGVRVSVHGTTQVATTDVNGRATLTLAAGNHRLTFEKAGYGKFGVEVEVSVTSGLRPNTFTMSK
jgi:hypothetical protein